VPNRKPFKIKSLRELPHPPWWPKTTTHGCVPSRL
jgi:hypothetical protein